MNGKKNMKTKKCFIGFLTACALLMFAGGALAHDLWLAPDNYKPAVGDTMKVMVGFGHKYPAARVDEKVRPGMIQEVNAVGPDGKLIKLDKKSDAEYALKIEAPGPYLISALMKPIYFSMAKGGRKLGNKKNLEEVKSCNFYRMIANAPIFAGAEAKTPAASQAGQALQVQPLADITALKNGDTLPVKVLFNGAPLAGAKLRATYAGFKAEVKKPPKPEKLDPNLSPKERARRKMMRHAPPPLPVETKTDAQGVAQIKLCSAGWWLVMVGHEAAYEDAAVCDKNVFKTTYTFEVH
jgi:uncharacterized GH25 family protein